MAMIESAAGAEWAEFCRAMMADGFRLYVYKARRSESRYITVTRKNDPRAFRVRFSDHPPLVWREEAGDCDFFVGRSNFQHTTAWQARDAIHGHFGRCTDPFEY